MFFVRCSLNRYHAVHFKKYICYHPFTYYHSSLHTRRSHHFGIDRTWTLHYTTFLMLWNFKCKSRDLKVWCKYWSIGTKIFILFFSFCLLELLSYVQGTYLCTAKLPMLACRNIYFSLFIARSLEYGDLEQRPLCNLDWTHL